MEACFWWVSANVNRLTGGVDLTRQISVFADGSQYPVTIENGMEVSFTWLPAGKQTAAGRDIHVGGAKIEDETANTISVSAQILGGLFHNKIVERHYPILKKLHGKPDTYKVHPNVVGLDFTNGMGR